MKHFFGIKDEMFIRGEVPMTKREVRMLLLEEAQILSSDIIIDVGAGTGSISIEAALAAKKGKVYAIERDLEGVELIKQNIAKFETNNVSVIHGSAPTAMQDLPKANVIIIGGSGGNLNLILDEAERLSLPDARILTTAITIETVYSILNELKKRKFNYDAYQMQINRIRKVGPYHMFNPLSPIFIVTGRKI